MGDAAAVDLRHRVIAHLEAIYPAIDPCPLADRLIEAMRLLPDSPAPATHRNHWDETDVAVITYGDSILGDDVKPLAALKRFLDRRLAGVINTVHLLPFFPWSSDDGFAVIDYVAVNDALGSWEDVERIASDYRLMADLVLNHCSSRSRWFEEFKQGVSPGLEYFRTRREGDDISRVVRPRESPLFQSFRTIDGDVDVWCTFGPDQVDFDFSNPEVLVEFARIVRFYIDRGIRILRLDAVAFLWKASGTECLNLPETHEIVRLLRTLTEHAREGAVLITETNIPVRENLSYFGNANEAHGIYNFSLPPLLVNTLLTGECRHLKTWMMSMPPAQNGTFYLNFIASHDGIGLRPVEGLLSEEEIDRMIATLKGFGALVSWRAIDAGSVRPYEVNVSLYDALAGTVHGPDDWQEARFVCAHAIMLALEGMPAFYIHSLVASSNDTERVRHTNHNRHINRRRWDDAELAHLLDADTPNARILDRLIRLVRIRKRQRAFHPNATQFTLHLGDALFAFWRQSADRRQSIFCINNISDQVQPLLLSDVNLIGTDAWRDLIGGAIFTDHRETVILEPYQTLWISNVDTAAG